jgi:hypothetical protein
MATTKKFIIAGASTLRGKTKVRFANDIMRIKILDKRGHENVNLVNLPYEMTKGEIAQYLLETEFMKDDAAVQEAILYTARKNPVAAKVAEPATEQEPVEA